MGDRLKGRVAIVTGAARGIGRGEALALASEGANIVLNDFGGGLDGKGGSSEPVDLVIAELKSIGVDAIPNYGSVADSGTGEEMVRQALEKWGRIDIVVNNAGILRDRMLFNMSEEEWDMVIAVHLKGTFNCTKPVAVYCRAEKHPVVVINTSSTSGLGNAGQSNYAAAKEGIIGFTRTMARELGRYGGRCNAIRPQAATRMTLSDDMRAKFERMGDDGKRQLKMIERAVPEQIGPFVAWLCTDEAANINGRNFIVSAEHIGLYSEPEIIAELSTTPDKPWSVDMLSQLAPQKVTGNLRNMFVPAPA